MTLLQGVFVVTALAAVISAVMVVASPRLVHAAVWLVITLGAVAVLFILLDAGFLAMGQVVIYIGAIAILIIFTAMLTRRGGRPPAPAPGRGRQRRPPERRGRGDPCAYRQSSKEGAGMIPLSWYMI